MKVKKTFHSVKKRSFGDRPNIFGKFAQAIVVLIFILVSASFVQGLNRIYSSRKKISVSQEKLRILEQTREELKTELEKTQSEYYKNKIAYEKLGLVKEGEVVIVLPDENLLRRLSPRIDEIEEGSTPKSNWAKWKEIFVD